jgi:hypothetical protein
MQILNIDWTILLLIPLVVFYFLPVIVARIGKHSNIKPVFIVNLVFGWTFVGWIAAIFWALMDLPKKKN